MATLPPWYVILTHGGMGEGAYEVPPDLDSGKKMGFDPCMMDPDDLPPLWSALKDRDFDLAEQLIARGAQLDDLIEDDGNTILHDAAQEGNAEMVEFFLCHGCPKSLESFDYIACTPLIRAASNGKTDSVVRLLSAGVNPNANDEERIGNTAIREAVRGGYTDIVEVLLRAGADPTIPGWMAISAVDQAWYEVEGSSDTVARIRGLLSSYPSALREKHQKQNEPMENKFQERPIED